MFFKTASTIIIVIRSSSFRRLVWGFSYYDVDITGKVQVRIF